MRKSIAIIICLLVLFCFAVSVQANNKPQKPKVHTFTFHPHPADMGDLDHGSYYDWRIQWHVPTGQTIVGAVLQIDNIQNWKYEPNANWLYTHLLDNPPTDGNKLGKDVWKWSDNQGGGDNWAGQGPLVGVFTDNGHKPQTITYDLGKLGLLPTLRDYAKDGVFGFGFDPDCHYYNNGISLTLKTTKAPTPEPGSLAVFGSGLMGLVAFAARKRQS